jgi:signal transduction histidine kinase
VRLLFCAIGARSPWHIPSSIPNIKVEGLYGELPRIVCAPAQIHQVILNLLVNAMQAIESTGRAGGRIEMSTQACRAEVILEIGDDGCSIPEEIRTRIFNPFFSTKPVGQGTGLGLAISQGIMGRPRRSDRG